MTATAKNIPGKLVTGIKNSSQSGARFFVHIDRISPLRLPPENRTYINPAAAPAQIKNNLPVKDVVIDIFLESDDQTVKIIDLNCWGEPTDPLLLRTFDQDWSAVNGIKLMLPPTKISGDVAVSF